MKKLMLLGVCSMVFLASCVSKKDYLALEAQQKETQDLLNTATVKLNSCLSDAAAANARVETMKDQLADLRKSNQDLIDTKGDFDEAIMFELDANMGAEEWVEFKGTFNSGDSTTVPLRCITSPDFNGVGYWDNVVLKAK